MAKAEKAEIQITVDDSELRKAFALVHDAIKALPVVSVAFSADLREVYKRLGKVWEARHV